MNVHTAISQGETEPLTTLLNKENADLISADKEGRSLLHTACAHGQTDIFELLTKHNVPLDTKDDNGDTPLLMAIKTSHYELAKRLLEKGAQPGLGNNRGITPLHSASSNGVEDLVQLLIKLGADVNAASINMNCPIHLATVSNHSEVLLHLLEAGANVNSKNSEGYTAVHMAFLGGHEDCMFALLACGADTIQDPIGNITLKLPMTKNLTYMTNILNAVQAQRTAAVEAVKSGELMSGIMKKLETIERRAVNIRNIHDHYKRVSSEKTKEIIDKANAEIEEWKKICPQVEHILVKRPDASTKVQAPTHPEPASSEPTDVPPRKKIKLTKTPKSESSIMLPD